MFEKIIRNGTVVTSEGTMAADVAIDGGKVAALLRPGEGDSHKSIDAAGRYVLPGVIDVHVHCATWTDHADTLADTHRSAAFGGTTTVITMLRPKFGMLPSEALAEFIELGNRSSVLDFSFHAILVPGVDVVSDIPRVIAAGVPTLKFFMAYKSQGIMVDDDLLYRCFQTIGEHGAMALVHAEDGILIDHLIGALRAEGRTGRQDFIASHPEEAEWLAMEKASLLARLAPCPLYILHISSAGAVPRLERVRRERQPVWGETCVQYLTLTNNDLLEQGGPAKISPPLRSRADGEGLWEGLRQGTISVVSSDHAPRFLASKLQVEGDIFAAPYGAPGAETLLPVMHDEMVVRRGWSLPRLVDVLSTQPARLFGLLPRKGVIQPGADADLVIFDPGCERVIRAADLHSNAGYSLYEGRQVKGWPERTLLRGQVLLDGSTLRQEAGYGRFIPRSPERLTR